MPGGPDLPTSRFPPGRPLLRITSVEYGGHASATEESRPDFTENARPNCRLSYQVGISDDLDGLIVRLPESQG